METFALEPANGYIVFKKDGETVLLDTGAPLTLHKNKVDGNGGANSLVHQMRGLLDSMGDNPLMSGLKATIANVTDEQLTSMLTGERMRSLAGSFGLDISSVTDSVASNSSMVDFDALEEHIGQPVTTIMGMAEIKNQKVLIDSVGNTISFGDDLSLEGDTLVCTCKGNYLFIKGELNGHEGKFVFDTGAPISYADKEFVQGLVPVDEKEDYSPYVGPFNTPVYDMTLQLRNFSCDIEVGVLPKEMQRFVEMNFSVLGDVPKAIIGGSLIQGRKILIDTAGRTITVG